MLKVDLSLELKGQAKVRFPLPFLIRMFVYIIVFFFFQSPLMSVRVAGGYILIFFKICLLFILNMCCLV